MSADFAARYRQMRRRSLERIALIKAMRAPPQVRRYEQLFMWGLRQWREHPEHRSLPVAEIPGFERNARRFAGIYDAPAGRA